MSVADTSSESVSSRKLRPAGVRAAASPHRRAATTTRPRRPSRGNAVDVEARTRDRREMRVVPQLRQSCHVSRCTSWSAPNRNTSGRRRAELVAQAAQRVDRVGRAAAVELARVDRRSGRAADGDVRARRSSIARRCSAVAARPCFCHGRDAGRKRTSSSASAVDERVGHREMRGVDRVEAAAEDADHAERRPASRAARGSARRAAPRRCRVRVARRSAMPRCGGIDIRIDSVRPPDCSPNNVPRS